MAHQILVNVTKRNINNGNHVLFMCFWALFIVFFPPYFYFIHYFLPNTKPCESIDGKWFFLFECKEGIFSFRIIFIYTVESTAELRVSCFLDLSVGCLLLSTLTHFCHGVVFVFNLYPFVYVKDWKKISFLDLVLHFQEIISFDDSKSLLILRF